MTTPTTTSAPGAVHARRAGLFMVSPAMLLMALFLILPFMLAFAMSFTNQRLVSPNPTQYVGLENYRQMLGLGVLTLAPEKDAQGQVAREADGSAQYASLRGYTRDNPDYPQLNRMREWFHIDWSGDSRLYVLASDVIFMKALVNTVLFVIVVAPVQAALALLLAMLINQPLRGINIYRTIFFMPVVISMVVVAFLWRFIYAGDSGLLNSLLAQLTFGAFKPVDWLGQPGTALWAIMAMSVWQGVGFHMIVWLSGLQTISASLYEAAALEGASKWQVFRYVTWPAILPVSVTVLLIRAIEAFKIIDLPNVLTNGGPGIASESMTLHAFVAWRALDLGGSAAVAYMLLFVVVFACMSVLAFVRPAESEARA